MAAAKRRAEDAKTEGISNTAIMKANEFFFYLWYLFPSVIRSIISHLLPLSLSSDCIYLP
jgi:hypothetical protein